MRGRCNNQGVKTKGDRLVVTSVLKLHLNNSNDMVQISLLSLPVGLWEEDGAV